MKILCIADVHGYWEGIEAVREFARENNIEDILILGDFPPHGNFHEIETAEFVLENLKDFNLMVIPGNCDPSDLLPLLREKKVSLHGEVRELSGIPFVGFGGSNPTPFNTILEFEEDYIYEKVSEIIREKVQNDNFILATHVPPKDTQCDLTSAGEHIGSSAVRKIIEEFKPKVAVSSHVHEAAGQKDQLGKSILGNIGKLVEGNSGIIEITDSEIQLELKNLKREGI